MFGRAGFWEILVVLVVVLLLFGAKRLPELSRSLGKSLSAFKKGREEGEREGETTGNGDTKKTEPEKLPDDSAGKS